MKLEYRCIRVFKNNNQALLSLYLNFRQKLNFIKTQLHVDGDFTAMGLWVPAALLFAHRSDKIK